jgi:hypothetical protein
MDGCDALENIKHKSQHKSSTSTASASLAGSSCSQQLEIQNNRIVLQESQLTTLGAAHQNVFTSLRTLERSQYEVMPKMNSFQRNLVQQDGLLRALLQYLWRDSIGTGLALVSLLFACTMPV